MVPVVYKNYQIKDNLQIRFTRCIRKGTFTVAEKPNNLRVFTVAELTAATNNFDRAWNIGEGGFGRVYRGAVKSLEHPFDEIPVAVKYAKGGHQEWLTEVNVLGVVVHPNLVKLVGYCAEDTERGMQLFLVYEYMPNGSLRDHLSPRSKTPLSWTMRLKVAQDAARGLAYLHEELNSEAVENIVTDEVEALEGGELPCSRFVSFFDRLIEI
ncbi:hypothetical protein LXL04_011651 [Taraxacum kok-saghyz]